MEIQNPTQHYLRRLHRFDILNEDLDQRVLIDVIEPLCAEGRLCIAIPYLLGYKADESISGGGTSVAEALNDCLAKIAGLSWEEFMRRVEPLFGEDEEVPT